VPDHSLFSLRTLVAVSLTTLALGCATQPPPSTAVAQATREIPESELLDVGIRVFDPGLPQPDEHAMEEQGIYPDVRKSEARFMAVTLMETMQATGQWGAVRVLPEEFGTTDLEIEAAIVESNGLELQLEVVATDSKGRVWIEKTYVAQANVLGYDQDEGLRREPFQHLYNTIANDLVLYRSKLEPAERRELRTISELKFAADLAPEAFGSYLTTDRKGRAEIAHAPAQGDPMIDRVAAIRERDALVIDTLNDHYATFTAQMTAPYDDLRSYSYEEQMALKELRRQARIRKIVGVLAIVGAVLVDPASSGAAVARDLALFGGLYAFQRGMALSSEAKIHLQAVQELAGSFDLEVAPLLVDVKGETLQLTGSAEVQYAAWRQLLREIFASEVGLPVDLNSSAEIAGEAGG